MKKCFSLVMICAIVFSICQFNVIANIDFPDVGQDHWAYQNISQLITDGTISGYEDGTFKPDNIVLRAEFVKMIGKGTTKKQNNFNDVDSSFWGYDYIMYSGLQGDADNNFNPNVPITRGDVAQLIWERAGSKVGVISPSIITSQYKNRDAIAWVYQYGIMIGNDGINLRLNDTLSRAEAATLIIRSRLINNDSKQIDFVNTVSPKVLETVYNNLNLFDNLTYSPDKNITNGEICRAGIRIASELKSPTYYGYEISAPFSHPYIYDLTAIGNHCFSKDKISKDFIDKQSNMQDALTVLAFSIIKKSYATLDYSAMNNYYKDIKSTDTDTANKSLTFANKNGIQLYADGILNANSPITLKEFTAILLQIDGLVGTQSAITTDRDVKTGYDIYVDQKLQTNIELYPANKDLFQCILADIPLQVYTTPFTVTSQNSTYGNPKLVYNFAREYSGFLTRILQTYKNKLLSNSKVEARFTYFPSLVCQNGTAYTLRVKCEILKTESELFIKDLFKTTSEVNETQKIHNGMIFYCDIASAQDVTASISADGMLTLDKIVYVDGSN